MAQIVPDTTKWDPLGGSCNGFPRICAPLPRPTLQEILRHTCPPSANHLLGRCSSHNMGKRKQIMRVFPNEQLTTPMLIHGRNWKTHTTPWQRYGSLLNDLPPASNKPNRDACIGTPMVKMRTVRHSWRDLMTAACQDLFSGVSRKRRK